MRTRRKSGTCIAILRDKRGKLWMAGDRRVSWGMHQAQIMPKAKIAYREGLLLGGTGCASICDEFVRLMSIPHMSKEAEPYDYMHNVFMPAVFDHLAVRKYLHEKERRIAYREGADPADDWYGALVLIGLRGDLFELTVDNYDISLDQIDAPYATGCGDHLALGSLLTTENIKMKEKDRLTLALQVAARVSPGCDNNIDIICAEE